MSLVATRAVHLVAASSVGPALALAPVRLPTGENGEWIGGRLDTFGILCSFLGLDA